MVWSIGNKKPCGDRISDKIAKTNPVVGETNIT